MGPADQTRGNKIWSNQTTPQAKKTKSSTDAPLHELLLAQDKTGNGHLTNTPIVPTRHTTRTGTAQSHAPGFPASNQQSHLNNPPLAVMFVETEPQPPCLELPFDPPTKLPKQITAGCHACTITAGATLKTAEQRGPGDQRSCAELNNSPTVT